MGHDGAHAVGFLIRAKIPRQPNEAKYTSL
jgi:hypothetical protein